MKPRNATERKLVRYAAALPPLTARQTQYAYDNSFVSYALFRRRGRKVKCMRCGNETVWEKPFLESFIDVDEYDCPQCGRSMPMKEWLRDTPMTDRRFFTVITTFRGIQLARTFDVTRDNSRTAGTRYGIEEIFQNWILDDGIRLEEKDLTVTVIPTVREILQEGEKMHHCVFRMKYYTRENSLLLSARDGNGKRLETVELSLKTFKVLQSRGILNKNSPRHDQIISLVERNAPLFRMRSAN